ncbi:type VI secretion system baseplate subunit TssE [Pseudoduganella sp. FT93W]|uniref:Type VI secretion system baseplate subunit TssE n=1 Tax=Duganella fentianensis TaxID=2692177 RepID=A0A845HYD0_9BURK|nr:type VI secretion system baseplate subunit TssE [Duganella fentianensis]MYN46210.1 type VI secretion system baseplate subunit TssE [Duganella fentianensis]
MVERNFAPSLWDRLMATTNSARTDGRISLDTYKAAITRDLEDLLNTRTALPDEYFAEFPASRRSIINYGLADFAALCLTSDVDQKVICNNLKEAIKRFEPRLSNVKTALRVERGTTNLLDFVIAGTLKAYGNDPLELNAVFQPSTLRYFITPKSGSLKGQPNW